MKPDVSVNSLFSTEHDEELTTEAVEMWITHSIFKVMGVLSHRQFCWGFVHTFTLFIIVQEEEFIAKAVDLWTMLLSLQILLLKAPVLVWSQKKTNMKKVDEEHDDIEQCRDDEEVI